MEIRYFQMNDSAGTERYTRNPSKNCHGSFNILHAASRSRRVWRSRPENLFRAQQLPPQVVHIKQQQRFRVNLAELFMDSPFPPFGEIGFGVHVLGEKAVFVRYAQKI